MHSHPKVEMAKLMDLRWPLLGQIDCRPPHYRPVTHVVLLRSVSLGRVKEMAAAAAAAAAAALSDVDRETMRQVLSSHGATV
jgi:predicted aconitase